MYKILLIDDDIVILSILGTKIRNILKKVKISTASNFGEALTLATINPYDLIIIDNIISYPGEGEDLANQIALLPKNQSTEKWIEINYRGDLCLLPKPIDSQSEHLFSESLKKWEIKCNNY